MNSVSRRNFLKAVTTVSVVVGISPSILIAGCAVNAKELLSTIVAQIQAIIKVAAPNVPWLSALQSALTNLQAGIANWDATNIVTDVTSALNTVLAVLSVIPLTEQFSGLIAVLVAGLETVLNVLVPPSMTAQVVNHLSNPYHGRVTLNKPHIFQTQLGAYKSQWNTEAVKAGLPQARI